MRVAASTITTSFAANSLTIGRRLSPARTHAGRRTARPRMSARSGTLRAGAMKASSTTTSRTVPAATRLTMAARCVGAGARVSCMAAASLRSRRAASCSRCTASGCRTRTSARRSRARCPTRGVLLSRRARPPSARQSTRSCISTLNEGGSLASCSTPPCKFTCTLRPIARCARLCFYLWLLVSPSQCRPPHARAHAGMLTPVSHARRCPQLRASSPCASSPLPAPRHSPPHRSGHTRW